MKRTDTWSGGREQAHRGGVGGSQRRTSTQR